MKYGWAMKAAPMLSENDSLATLLSHETQASTPFAKTEPCLTPQSSHRTMSQVPVRGYGLTPALTLNDNTKRGSRRLERISLSICSLLYL